MANFEKGDIVVRTAYVPTGMRGKNVRQLGIYRVENEDPLAENLKVEGSDYEWDPRGFRKIEGGDIVQVIPGLYAGTGWSEEMEVISVRDLIESRPIRGDLSYTEGAFPPSEIMFVRPREKTDSEKTVDRWMEGYGEKVEVPDEHLVNDREITSRDVIWARNWVVSMEDHMSAADFFDHLVGSGLLSNDAILALSSDFKERINEDI